MWTTPILRLVVKASQTKRNVRDLVFSAPKTPATASVDLPDWRAAARENATDMIWALSVRAALHSFQLSTVADGQCLGASPVISRANNEKGFAAMPLHHQSDRQLVVHRRSPAQWSYAPAAWRPSVRGGPLRPCCLLLLDQGFVAMRFGERVFDEFGG